MDYFKTSIRTAIGRGGVSKALLHTQGHWLLKRKQTKTNETKKRKQNETERTTTELKRNNDVAVTKTQQNTRNENKLTHQKRIEQSAEVRKDRRIPVLLYWATPPRGRSNRGFKVLRTYYVAPPTGHGWYLWFLTTSVGMIGLTSS